MRRKAAGILGVLAVVVATTQFGAGIAGAGGPTLDITPTGDRTVPEWEFEPSAPEPPSCEDADYDVRDSEGESVDADAYTVTAGETDDEGTLSAHGLEAGEYTFWIFCGGAVNGAGDVGAAQALVYVGEFAFARLTVTKQAEWPPHGATFVIEVDCEGDDTFAVELVFDTEGAGQHYEASVPVIAYAATVCEIEETEDGGATSTEIDNPTVDFTEEPIEAEVTVTNHYAAAGVPGTPPGTPPPSSEPSGPPASPVPSGAARPVSAAPTFTG